MVNVCLFLKEPNELGQDSEWVKIDTDSIKEFWSIIRELQAGKFADVDEIEWGV